MVWCAILYALIGSLLTWRVGVPLIALNTERYAREADLRFALVRVSESAESVALFGGERDERRQLEGNLDRVITSMRSEERRVGKECASTCRSRRWLDH